VVAREHELREQTTISVLTTAPVSQRDAVAESNHRIANNLSLLAGMVRMYVRTLSCSEEPLENEKIGALFDDIGCRIDAIAHLHALLARGEHDEPIDLAAYLSDVATTIMSSMSYTGRAELTTLPSAVCTIAPERGDGRPHHRRAGDQRAQVRASERRARIDCRRLRHGRRNDRRRSGGRRRRPAG
jgi:hypothetical protein